MEAFQTVMNKGLRIKQNYPALSDDSLFHKNLSYLMQNTEQLIPP
jgi:hypothetical protein